MHYLLQVNLYLCLFFVFYHLFLKTETFHKANRFYLLLSGLIAFVIPFLNSEEVKSWFITNEVGQIMGAYTLATGFEEPVNIVSSQMAFTLKDFLHGFYVLGLIFFTAKFGIKIYKTVKYVVNFDATKQDAFSFFGKIKVGESLKSNQAVLNHERFHVSQCHSIDILVFEVIAILCWMNPLVYLLKKEVKLLHEYQADEFATRNEISKVPYIALLISHRMGVKPEMLLANRFFEKSQLKSRIEMLNKRKSKENAQLKYGLIAPLFLGMVICSSASIASSEGLKKIEKYSATPIVESLKPSKEVGVDLSEFEKGGKVKTFKNIQVQNYSESELIIKTDTLREDELLAKLDKKPEFPGGDRAMYRYLGQNVIYPKNASKNGMMGKVVVGFVINEDGSVSDAKIIDSNIKSLEKPELDKNGLVIASRKAELADSGGISKDDGIEEIKYEAVRVVSNMPNWTPGMLNDKPVKVFHSIPLMFTLE